LCHILKMCIDAPYCFCFKGVRSCYRD
jgi:hypothetical protein